MDKHILEIIFNTEIQEEKGNSQIIADSFKKRVLKIKKNPSTKATFNFGEIAGSLFDMDLALKNLTDEEFNKIMDEYENYLKNPRKLKFNYEEFKSCCVYVMASYNAIAPYKKICNFDISDDGLEEIEIFTKLNKLGDTTE